MEELWNRTKDNFSFTIVFMKVKNDWPQFLPFFREMWFQFQPNALLLPWCFMKQLRLQKPPRHYGGILEHIELYTWDWLDNEYCIAQNSQGSKFSWIAIISWVHCMRTPTVICYGHGIKAWLVNLTYTVPSHCRML